MQNANYSRQFPRYRVYHYSGLEVRIESNFFGLDHVVNIGAGGCGFYGAVLDDRLQERLKQGLKVRVTCHLRLETLGSKNFEIQANVLYSMPLTLEGKKIYYYGLEFIPMHRKKLMPLIRGIEDLVAAGEIKLD